MNSAVKFAERQAQRSLPARLDNLNGQRQQHKFLWKSAKLKTQTVQKQSS